MVSVVLNVLGISLIIVLGAFLISLLADGIMCLFDNHRGVYFNKKEKTTDAKDVVIKDDDIKVLNIDAPNDEIVAKTEEEKEDVEEVDFDKAIEEQKLVQNANKKVTPTEEDLFEDNEEVDFDSILNDVSSEALTQYNKSKPEVEEVKEEVVVKNDEESDSIKALREELEQEREEIAKLKEQLDAKDEKNSRKVILKQKPSTENEELENAREKYLLEVDELDRVKKEWYRHQQELAEASKENESLENKELEDELLKAQLELADLKKFWKSREQELIDESNRQRKEDSKSIENLSKELEESKDEIDSKQEEIDKLEKASKEFEEEKARLDQMKQDWEDKELELLTMQEQQRSLYKEQIDKLSLDLEKSIKEIEAKEAEIEKLRDAEKDFTQEVKELKEMKETWAKKEKDLVYAENQLKLDEKRTIEELVKKLDEYASLISKKQKDSDSLKAEIDRLELEIENTKDKEKLAKLLAEIENIKRLWQQVEEELIDLQASRDNDRKLLLQKIAIEIDETKKEIKDKENEIKSNQKDGLNTIKLEKELDKIKDAFEERYAYLSEIRKAQNATITEMKVVNVGDDNTKYIKIARMNARLARIMSDTSKVEHSKATANEKQRLQSEIKQTKNELSSNKVVKETYQKTVTVENGGISYKQFVNPVDTDSTIEYKTEYIAPKKRSNDVETLNEDNFEGKEKVIVIEPAETIEEPVKNKVLTKPAKEKSFYESQLEDLEAELKDAQKEYKKVSKDYLPIIRIKKAFDKDIIKFQKQSASIARQKVVLYGVRNNPKLTAEKKKKLDDDMKKFEELKDVIQTSENFLKANEKRLPDLERNYNLAIKHIKRLNQDIEDANNALNWYNNNK